VIRTLGQLRRRSATSAPAKYILRNNLVVCALAVLPAVAGAFVGAPLVAREIENGTERLAWTQGVTRAHWLLMKVSLVCVPLLLGAALVGILEVPLINAQGPNANHWDHFDQQAPITIASTAFCASPGYRRRVGHRQVDPGNGGTLLGFVVTRVAVGELARPDYMTPVTTSDPSAVPSSAWWLNASDQVMISHGHFLVQLQLYGRLESAPGRKPSAPRHTWVAQAARSPLGLRTWRNASTDWPSGLRSGASRPELMGGNYELVSALAVPSHTRRGYCLRACIRLPHRRQPRRSDAAAHALRRRAQPPD
jgi:hypothetical protein